MQPSVLKKRLLDISTSCNNNRILIKSEEKSTRKMNSLTKIKDAAIFESKLSDEIKIKQK